MPQPQPVTDPLSLVHHIDRQTIEHLAGLARIRLTAEETAAVEEHLHSMFVYIEKLRQVDTEGIEPMSHAVDVAAPLRADAVTNQPNAEALLQNAPARSGDFLVVPRIIE